MQTVRQSILLRLFIAVGVMLLLSGSSASALTQNPWKTRRVLNIAHQGGEYEAPSDTMFAFKTALDKGADVLELDVHATADGEIVALHDDTVNRTTNGTGAVDELTLAQIQSLDAAHWFAQNCGTCHDKPASDYVYRGYATGERPIPAELAEYTPSDFRIPTLREVLQEFPNTLLNIEIKATAPNTTPYEKKVSDLLKEFNRGDDTIVVSFNDASMALFKLHNAQVSAAPGIVATGAFWASTQGPLPGIPLPGFQALQVPLSYQGLNIVSQPFITKAHNNNLAVHAWTIDDADQMRTLIDQGVDGIMSSRPSVLEAVLEEKGVKYQ